MNVRITHKTTILDLDVIPWSQYWALGIDVRFVFLAKYMLVDEYETGTICTWVAKSTLPCSTIRNSEYLHMRSRLNMPRQPWDVHNISCDSFAELLMTYYYHPPPCSSVSYVVVLMLHGFIEAMYWISKRESSTTRPPYLVHRDCLTLLHWWI